MKTPAWFIQEDEILHVQTAAKPGRAKCICSSGRRRYRATLSRVSILTGETASAEIV